MTNTGFDGRFYIRRKRNLFNEQFLAFLDGPGSLGTVWTDREDTGIDPVADGIAWPDGFALHSGETVAGNLGVDGETIAAFTIAAVVVRDDQTNNDAIVENLFGTAQSGRLYFAANTLTAQVKIDGNTKTVTVSDCDTFMQNGRAHLIILRGTAGGDLEVLVDNVSRGTATASGTALSVSSGDFTIGNDAALSYGFAGSVRFFAAIAKRLDDGVLATLQMMLEYEGYFDLLNDDFSKWNGSGVVSSGTQYVGDSYLNAAIVEPS